MEVLDVLAEEPYNVSLAVYNLGDEENGFFHNERAMRPLASTIKILVLAEYARRVTEGELNPDELIHVDSLNSYYFEGTDGGAHEAAMDALEDAGRLEDDQLSLHDVSDAMIRFSDNTAADYFILRFGREAMEALPERVGTPYTEPPLPISGLFLAWDLPYQFGEDPSLSASAMEDRAWHFGGRLRNSWKFVGDMQAWMEDFGERMTYYDLSAAVLSFPAGSARAYADIMADLYRGELISQEVSELMLEYLDWPMENEGMSSAFTTFATKGGSLPSVLTSAYVIDRVPAEGTDHPPTALSLLIEGLSEEIWLDWLTTFKHQEFELRLMTDPAFRYVALERLRDK